MTTATKITEESRGPSVPGGRLDWLRRRLRAHRRRGRRSMAAAENNNNNEEEAGVRGGSRTTACRGRGQRERVGRPPGRPKTIAGRVGAMSAQLADVTAPSTTHLSDSVPDDTQLAPKKEKQISRTPHTVRTLRKLVVI